MLKINTGHIVEQTVSMVVGDPISKLLKNFSSYVYSRSTATIVISEWDTEFRIANKLIRKMDENQFKRHMSPTANAEYQVLQEGTRYIIRKKGYSVVIDCYKDEVQSFPIKKLRIDFRGDDKFKRRMQFIQRCSRATDRDKIHLEITGNHISMDIIPHTFDTIILKKDVKERLVSGLYSWGLDRSWYKEHNLIHKIGVFLYGNPGTGKTTIAKAICALFGNCPLVMIDVSNISGSIEKLIVIRKKILGPIVVLLEDVDLLFSMDRTPRKKEKNEQGEVVVTETNSNNKENQEVSKDLNLIFQLLDGMFSTQDTIFIATTNHPEALDPAMIRAGRFDIREKIDYFGEEDADQFIEMMGIDVKEFKEWKKMDCPIQPAKLQAFCMQYRATHRNTAH